MDEYRGSKIVEALELTTGNKVPEQLKEDLSRGADELDLVRSGLDDTMRLAYQQISDVFHEDDRIKDFRIAAFVLSIGKVARTYMDMGI